MAEIIIDDNNYHNFLTPPIGKKMGCIPRDYAKYPLGYLLCAKPFDLPLIPESEWQSRLDAQIAAKAQLSDIRNRGNFGAPIPSRDQDGKGYCVIAGAKITLFSGECLSIEQIRPGDMVVTAEGRSGRVTETMARHVSEPVIKLFIGDSQLTLTGEHPVLTHQHGYMPAWTLKQGMDVCYGLRSWAPLKAKEIMPFSGPVFNLGVAGDNSYVAEGVGVHNCWAHSSTSAALIARAANNEPYADLSAYMVACIIKGYQDEGGWGSESVEFIAQNGIPTSEFWPQQSMSRSNDNPAMRANAALHKFTEWMDLDPGQMKAQLVTCLLSGIPVVTDHNWWSHSICTIDLVNLNPFRTRIWNSWGDSWSENGTGILEGSKAIPDAALGCRVSTPSVV